MTTRRLALLALVVILAACGRIADVGRVPELRSPVNGNEVYAMNTGPKIGRASLGKEC